MDRKAALPDDRATGHDSMKEVRALIKTANQRIVSWAQSAGIHVADTLLERGKAGWFDGISVTMNNAYPAAERLFYLVHALGSIVIWSVAQELVQGLFDELREAKRHKETENERFERAVGCYSRFEIRSSSYAVTLLHDLDCAALTGRYSNFMRADLETMTEFHRSGQAPVWREFFLRWNMEVESGKRQIEPFESQPIPAFRPIQIEKQEILQQQPRAQNEERSERKGKL